MSDVLCIVLILVFFGVAHVYTWACDRLRTERKP